MNVLIKKKHILQYFFMFLNIFQCYVQFLRTILNIYGRKIKTYQGTYFNYIYDVLTIINI